MTTALVVGAGAVGTHAARQLAATAGIAEVLVTDVDADRATSAADEAGVRAVSWVEGDALPAGVAVVACAAPDPVGGAVAEAALDARAALASVADDEPSVQRLLDLHAVAAECGVALVTGAGLAPGLSESLAAFAASTVDRVDEVHVARVGAAGPACRATARRAARRRPRQLDGGAWSDRRRRSGRRVVYFPAPIGPRECWGAASPVSDLVARALPGVGRVTASLALGPGEVVGIPARSARWARGLGGVHVEVRGERGGERVVSTLGAALEVAPASGAVLASAACAAAGMVTGVALSPGVHGVGQIPPGPFLAELARRGVRAARFAGED